MEEIEFIGYFKSNPEAAFKYLVDNYSGFVYNTALSLVFKGEDAEDVTQEVFLAVYSSLGSFKGESKLSTWIYGVTVNKSREFIRSKTRQKRQTNKIELDDLDRNLGFEVSHYNHPGIELEKKELANIFFSALDQLPENQRIAFTLHKIEGHSYQEIAVLMETSLSSIESLMFRARKNLQNILEDYYNKFYR